MIYDNIGLKPLGENEAVLAGTITQNNIPVLDENYVKKMNANNGFSQDRLFRKVASIPLVAWMKATQDGYNMDDEKDVRRFLLENPDYLCVDKLDKRSDPHIIVK